MWKVFATGGWSTLATSAWTMSRTHPAFRNAVQTLAGFYDFKANPSRRKAMSYDEDGETHSIYYLKARNREDLARRSDAHRILAQTSYGLLGRSPDYIASFVTGMNSKPELFWKIRRQRARLLQAYARSRYLCRACDRVAASRARSGFLPTTKSSQSKLPGDS